MLGHFIYNIPLFFFMNLYIRYYSHPFTIENTGLEYTAKLADCLSKFQISLHRLELSRWHLVSQQLYLHPGMTM